MSSGNSFYEIEISVSGVASLKYVLFVCFWKSQSLILNCRSDREIIFIVTTFKTEITGSVAHTESSTRMSQKAITIQISLNMFVTFDCSNISQILFHFIFDESRLHMD